MQFIKVWCEYDISGQFGANNNEEVLAIDDVAENDAIDEAVLKLLQDQVSEISADEQGETWDWEWITVGEVKINQ